MDDGNEDDGSDGGRSERIPESAAEDPELQEEPAADEPNENPADETLLPADDNNAFLEQHGESGKHGASLASKGWGILAQQPGRKKEESPEDPGERGKDSFRETSGGREPAASCNGWCRARERGRERERPRLRGPGTKRPGCRGQCGRSHR